MTYFPAVVHVYSAHTTVY